MSASADPVSTGNGPATERALQAAAAGVPEDIIRCESLTRERRSA